MGSESQHEQHKLTERSAALSDSDTQELKHSASAKAPELELRLGRLLLGGGQRGTEIHSWV